MDDEDSVWRRYHQHNVKSGGVPTRLFSDDDPATTIKGLGFRNAVMAQKTIRLSGQPGCAYKQYWTVRAMAERARFHPHPTADMRAALAVFDDWLRARRTLDGTCPSVPPLERAQRLLLSQSPANAHARSRCVSDTEHRNLLARDRRVALAALRSATTGVEFSLPSTAFVAIFGSPGEHGYGSHICNDANKAGLASWRCLCGFQSQHTLRVVSLASLLQSANISYPKMGKMRIEAFELMYDGVKQKARLYCKPARGQSTLKRFFRPVDKVHEIPPSSSSVRIGADSGVEVASKRLRSTHAGL